MMVGVILETIGVQWVDILDMIAAVAAAGAAHVWHYENHILSHTCVFGGFRVQPTLGNVNSIGTLSTGVLNFN